jgi:hypothetical protein
MEVINLKNLFLTKRFINFISNKNNSTSFKKKYHSIINSTKNNSISDSIKSGTPAATNINKFTSLNNPNFFEKLNNKVSNDVVGYYTPQYLKSVYDSSILFNQNCLLIFLNNPILLKMHLKPLTYNDNSKNSLLSSFDFKSKYLNKLLFVGNPFKDKTSITHSNLTPSKSFSKILLKKVYTTLSRNKLLLNFIPIYYTTLVRFIEDISGLSTLIQFYPFVNQSISTLFIIKYKL